MSAENIMIPWIYLCYNRDFDQVTGRAPWSETDPAKLNSLNSSRQPVAATGISTNINKSGVLINNNLTLNQYDSQLNASSQ